MLPRKLLFIFLINFSHANEPTPRQFPFISSLKQFFNFGSPSADPKTSGPPPKMRELHRLPKPPKYPLYDLDAISLATPPPAPVMHPMSSLPADQFSYEGAGNGAQERREILGRDREWDRDRDRDREREIGRGEKREKNNNHHQRSNRPPTRRRGQPPPPPPEKTPNRRPKPHHPRRPQSPQSRKPWKFLHHPQTPPPLVKDEYIEHPMASNLEAVKASPALGRPLGWEEYMERPSTSFVHDPWNFDPFALQMNAGLQTSGLKYNYNPLGTTSNDIDMSHLNPDKLSFLGDSFIKDSKTSMYSGNQQSNNYVAMENNGDLEVAGSETQQGNLHKIEFTIETSPDGQVNIQQTPTNNKRTDEYSPQSSPLGPSGYNVNHFGDGLTPNDMLPPANTPTSPYSNHN